MAYDRYERRSWRDEPRGFDDDRYSRDRGHPRDRDERGFFERAGDEIASWFGDDDAERRRQRDERFDDRHERGHGRAGGWSMGGRDRDYDRSDYRTDRDFGRSEYGSRSDWDRDNGRRGRLASSRDDGRFGDPHYESWRNRRMEELDRDYDDYRRERETRFEDDFSSWRDRRQSKRQLLGQIREHMEVTGKDGEHVGTVDRVAGDRIILARSDPDSGGTHHSLPCTMIEEVGDKVMLDVDADKAKQRWRDDSRERALFEREDQGEAGPHILDRSFSGTYR